MRDVSTLTVHVVLVAMIRRELVRVDMASRNNFDKVCRAKLAEKFN